VTVGPLHGRRLLVTGASAGIGRSTVDVLVGAGARVACAARRADRLDDLAEATGAIPVVLDVRDDSQVARTVDDAASRLGGLDGVVNNAGILRTGVVGDVALDEWRAMFETNVIGLLAVTSAALPLLREAGGGDIVNVSSLSGRRIKSPDSAVYSASKSAVHVISEGLRQQLHGNGIRVSVISPGVVATDLAEGVTDEHGRDQLSRRQLEYGLDARVVAEQVLHVLSQPPGVTIMELAVLPSEQRR